MSPVNKTTDPQPHVISGLEQSTKEEKHRPAFCLTKPEFKLLSVAGVGFLLDAYDLFIINPVSTMLMYRLYNGQHLPTGLEGFIKAGANIGSVIGQFLFGYLADSLGRKAVYGKELLLIIIATIFCIADPTNVLSANGALIWLGCFRIILGIGVGGDYPLSASVATDRANVRKRGVLLSYVFANQGWGSLIGSIVTLIVLACYRHVIEDEGKISRVDGAWRIIVGISLVPAFAMLYQRHALPESERYKKEKAKAEGKQLSPLPLETVEAMIEVKEEKIEDKDQQNNLGPALSVTTMKSRGSETVVLTESEDGKEKAKEVNLEKTVSQNTAVAESESESASIKKKKGYHREVWAYFKQWKNAKILLGTCMCWFLVDIAFYGINLNQNVVLQEIGFGGQGGSAWHNLFEIAIGNLIITALGFLPGYYVTVLTIEYLGRKWIQIQGFLMAALFLAILAGKFHTLSTGAFVVCFAFLQFFFNFGANATTYCYPAEVFPTRYRGFAHGISAAAGKAGAIISALAFNSLSKKIGTPAVLWIFFGCCIAGAVFTLLLPEVKGRDPDAILAEEEKAKAKAQVRV